MNFKKEIALFVVKFKSFAYARFRDEFDDFQDPNNSNPIQIFGYKIPKRYYAS